jgi:hypothetical protein
MWNNPEEISLLFYQQRTVHGYFQGREGVFVKVCWLWVFSSIITIDKKFR